MERRSLVALVLCFFIFFAWQKLYMEPRIQQARQAEQGQQVSQSNSPTQTNQAMASASTQTGVAATTQAAAEVKTLGTQIGSANISNGNKLFVGWDLKSYRLGIAKEAAAVDMKSVTQTDGEVEVLFDTPNYAYLNDVRQPLVESPQSLKWTHEDGKIKLVREITSAPNQAYLNLRIQAEFKDKPPGHVFISLTSKTSKEDPQSHDRQLVYWNGSQERVSFNDAIAPKDVLPPVKWIGAADRYFLMTLVNDGGPEARGLIQSSLVGPGTTAEGRASLVFPVNGNSIQIPLRVYFGPKELDVLRGVEPTLDHTVDFGWFTVFAYPLLRLMRWLYEIVHNYGVAIILLTLLVKLATFPLTYKSMKSMKEMAKIQPQLQKIREKYKDDKETLNREMLNVMRTHGYNPAAGCLPILIQMPVFFALYRVLYSSIELYHAPFAFWIHDLSSKDPFYVTPVLMTATMFLQQKLTPNTATDPAQARMMQFMPVIFGVFMLSLPSGLTLYMLVNALSSILQQLFLNKKMGTGSGRAAVPAHA